MSARGHIDFVRQDTQGFIAYDCRQCAAQPYLYDKLGHDGPPTDFYRENKVTGNDLDECPVMTLLKHPKESRELQRMEEDYQLFTAGFLKVAGGIVDQPARWLEWMRRIGTTRSAVQAAYVKPATED